MRLQLGMLLLFFTVQGWAMNEYYGPTTSQDHLWHIASLSKPSNQVTVQQTMMAIYQANPEAFEAGNINGLRAGFLLHLPSLGSATQNGAEQAKQWVAKQNASWKQAENSHQGITMKTEAQWPSSQSQSLVTSDQSYPQKPLNQLDDIEFRGKTDTEIKVLSQKMADLVETNQVQKQTYDSQLKQLESENRLLKAQIANIDQRMNLLAGDTQLNNEVSGLLGSTSSPELARTGTEVTQALTYQEDPLFSDTTVKTAFGIAILLLILAACFFWPRRVRAESISPARTSKPLTDDDEDTHNEYDFMHSEEGIPAQLDLARAYIDMDDVDAAREVLDQVMQKGNQQQQHEAQGLLKQAEIS